MMEQDLRLAERNAQAVGKAPFFKIVLTGGPCAGKTTALARISSFLRERGYEVISRPEVFTLFESNGMPLNYFGTPGMGYVVQRSVMDVQLSMEDNLETILRATGQPAVLLCDRGAMDGAAYIDKEDWQKYLVQRGKDNTGLRDSRYNAVLHLVTAAEGAESHYTLENNATRTETAEEARQLDERTRRAWSGHAQMYVFDNSTDFEGKLQRIVERISKIVGLPTDLQRISTKFLLLDKPSMSDFPADIPYHVFHVEKVYLINHEGDDKAYSFIRSRTAIDECGTRRGTVYQLTTVKRASGGSSGGTMIEQKRIITAREYAAAYQTRDTSRRIVRQNRISFLYLLQSFTIHVYESPAAGLCILHAQVAGRDQESKQDTHVELPSFLSVDRQLHGPDDENKYGAYSISKMEK